MGGSEKIRIILAIKNLDVLHAIQRVVEDTGFDVIGIAADGVTAMKLFRQNTVDFIISEIVLPGLDVYGMLEAISASSVETMPGMIVLSLRGMERHDEKLLKMGVYRVFRKPIDPEDFIGAMKSADVGARIAPRFFTEERVREVLWNLGLNPRLAGTAFLTTAVMLTARDLRLAGALTTRLYPMVGARFGTDGRGVERCMRRSIESAWATGTLTAQHELFGDSIDEQRGKPTCSELIVRVTDFLKLKECGTYDKASSGGRA